jgi:hypothetical protein
LRPLSRTRFSITNANPACSCVYICKFQFRPIHPPSRRLSAAPSTVLPFCRPRRVSVVASTTVSFAGALCTGNPQWFPLSPIPRLGPCSTSPLRRSEFAAAAVSRRPANQSPLAPCQAAPSAVSRQVTFPRPSSALIWSHRG